ncbi:YceI family protein [Duganella sp. HH101]|uniref:YceI family protein n=1 Tax=Duganella sp. HH101 TaxID=1781066 RepID=UPI000874C440|nr:YceI family protein [Duganella sp. HH101]
MTKFHSYQKTIALAALLAGCSQLPSSAPPAPPEAPPPAVAPAHTPAANALTIDSAQSLIAVTVRRGGLLARLGHDHLVASRHVSGTVSPAQNRADFQFRLDQLTVDEADLRIAAGLEKQPSADAIDGTRNNMLTRVLDAERYPVVTVHAERAAGQPLQVAITLHGVTRSMAIPAEIRENHGVMTVTGNVNLKQSDFGITPFSVMAGALAVQDQLELRFTLAAK